MKNQKKGNRVFLGLGSNIGNKRKNLINAIKLIDSHNHIEIKDISKFYLSPPYGFEEQESFINCVIEIATDLTPFDLLKVLKEMEKKLGRKPTFRWGPRIIDIDILFYEDVIINEKELIVPHPDIQNRAFVLVPMVEIDSEFFHPLLKKTVYQLMNELNIRDIMQLKQEEVEDEIFYRYCKY